MGCVCVILGMYSNAQSHVRVNDQCSVKFGVGVGVQGSALSPLLFILVLEAHEFHTGVPWELLYAGDLVLFADTQEDCISKFKAWKVRGDQITLNYNGSTAMTVPWSAGSVAPKPETKHH